MSWENYGRLDNMPTGWERTSLDCWWDFLFRRGEWEEPLKELEEECRRRRRWWLRSFLDLERTLGGLSNSWEVDGFENWLILTRPQSTIRIRNGLELRWSHDVIEALVTVPDGLKTRPWKTPEGPRRLAWELEMSGLRTKVCIIVWLAVLKTAVGTPPL